MEVFPSRPEQHPFASPDVVALAYARAMAFRKGQRVVRLCSDKSGRYVASHVWTVLRVSRRDGVIVIGDAHGVSHWTYDLAGTQREKNVFVSEIVELRD